MRKPLKVIAFDPGELTGWARGYIDPDDHTVVIEAAGYDPWKTVALAFDRTMSGDDPYDVVIYETWRLRKDKALELAGSDMQSSQFIGCVKLSVWRAQHEGHVVRICGQGPNIKPVVDAWKGGTAYLPVDSEGKEHARDATRHLFYRACKPEDDNDPGYGVRP